jgi:hypothetical protein
MPKNRLIVGTSKMVPCVAVGLTAERHRSQMKDARTSYHCPAMSA